MTYSPDYTTTLVVEQSPSAVYDAINNVRAWWSEDIDGRTDVVDGEFVFHGHDIHRSQIRVTELVPAERVTWLVVDNYIKFVQDQTEWTGTRITFELTTVEGGTELRFRHHGLVPAYECFDACSSAWSFFINASLRGLITTGAGQPMAKTAVTT
jgi:hypothetical protein